MLMIVTHPWPTPAETSTVRLWEVEEAVRWTRRERLRLLWYRVRLTAGGVSRAARRARERP
jgi:hypothetical protein